MGDINFSLIFFGIFAFFAFFAALFGMLRGRKYNWMFSLARVIIVVVSAILAMLLSALIAWFVGGAIVDFVMGLSFVADIQEVLNAMPSAPDAVSAIIAMVIAPAIFFTLFLIVKAILNKFSGKVCKLLMKIGKKKLESVEASEEVVTEESFEAVEQSDAAEMIEESEVGEQAEVGEEAEVSEEAEAEEAEEAPALTAKELKKQAKKEKKQAKWNKKHNADLFSHRKFDPAGALCGAICGFLVYVVMLVPIVCPIDSVDSVIKIAGGTEAGEDKVFAMVIDISDAAANNAGAKTVKALGGNLLYRGLTTYPVGGRMASLKNETRFLTSVGDTLVYITGENVDKSVAAESLVKVSKNFEKSTLIPVLASELLSAASDDWSRGEKFCGMEPPSVGEDFDVLLEDLFGAMKDSTPDTICEDFDTIIGTVALMVEHDAMGSFGDEDGLLDLFKNEELVSGVMLKLLDNERLSPVVAGFTNMGISLFADSLGIKADAEELYKSFKDEMSISVYREISSMGTVTAESFSEIADNVKSVYDDHGIAISDGVAACIAVSAINDVTGGSSNVSKFFGSESLKADSVLMLSTSSNNAKAIEFLVAVEQKTNKSTTAKEFKAIVAAELRSSVGIDELSDEEVADIADDIATALYKDISKGTLDYSKVVAKDSAEFRANSVSVTADSMHISMKDITDVESESKAIAKVFASALDIVDSLSGEDIDIDEIMASFGPVLDAFADCELIGRDRTGMLLKSVLQSEMVRGNIGFSVVQATSLADSIVDGASGENESYTTLLESLGSTVNVIITVADEGDITAVVVDLMKGITPASANVLQQMVTPETMRNYGVPEESAEPIANMLSDMFGNMATAKEDGMTDEEYEQESEAVDDLLNFVMNAEDADNSAFGDESTTGATVTEFVDKVLASKVISKTLVNAVYVDGATEPTKDPLVLDSNLSEDDREEVSEALNSAWNSASGSAEEKEQTKKVLTSIASILNLSVTFSGNGLTVTG